MGRAAVLVLVGLLCVCLPVAFAGGPQTLWFKTQRRDHFNPEDQTLWSQRYVYDDTNWDGSGPVFFFLSGEAPMEVFEFQEVLPQTLSANYKALYLKLEHRYYGPSSPVANYSTPNLKYLSAEQALEDAANFIVTLNQTVQSTQWVVWGCSYSGALSAWFRLKYPHLVLGSVAPSGPVLAQSNYTGYLDWFATQAPTACTQQANQSSIKISQMLQTASGRQQLAQAFQACESTIAEEDIPYFVYSINGALGSADQFDNPNQNFTLNQTCDQFLNASNDPLVNWGYIVSGGSGCVSYSTAGFIQSMHDVNVSTSQRSWWWQKCTEFGFFKPSYPGSSPNAIFPFNNVDDIVGWCAQMFDLPGLAPNIQRTNTLYGGLNLKATNVAFTNGLRDPWHLLSITTPSQGIESIIYEAGHCAPMNVPTPWDEPSLVNARVAVDAFIGGLLGVNKK